MRPRKSIDKREVWRCGVDALDRTCDRMRVVDSVYLILSVHFISTATYFPRLISILTVVIISKFNNVDLVPYIQFKSLG